MNMKSMIAVMVNGKSYEIAAEQNLQDALSEWGYTLGSPMAVAINERIISRAQFAAQPLQDGDQIDIVLPTPGG